VTQTLHREADVAVETARERLRVRTVAVAPVRRRNVILRILKTSGTFTDTESYLVKAQLERLSVINRIANQGAHVGVGRSVDPPDRYCDHRPDRTRAAAVRLSRRAHVVDNAARRPLFRQSVAPAVATVSGGATTPIGIAPVRTPPVALARAALTTQALPIARQADAGAHPGVEGAPYRFRSAFA
jgi:hypothetical protein